MSGSFRFFNGIKSVIFAMLCLLAVACLVACGQSGGGTEASTGGSESELDSTQMGQVMNAGDKYSLDNMKWWQKTNAYEIYVNSFQDSDGNGYGDLNGIRSRLDHLKELGVGAVWLTPVYASPMVDNGYDVADYYAINPDYGTMEDMDRLIKEADEKGIKIVMDLVYNHTSDQCKWFLESSKDKENDYADWYIWRDPKEDGSEPNNWRSIFGGSAWTWCEARGQYYLHTFASAQPDLNWANPEVRKELFNVANFWIDKGVGGFRMDAIPYIKKPDDFSDGPADDKQGMVSVHDMTANTEGILDYLKEFKENVTEGTDVFTVAEANGIKPEDLHLWVGENGVFDMLFEFGHAEAPEVWCKASPFTLTKLKNALTASQQATADMGWYPIYFENHDKPRSINFYFPEDADPVLAGRTMGTILLTLRGTPFIYQGEELGYQNMELPSIDDYDDVNSKPQYDMAIKEGFSQEEAMAFVHAYSRDNARTPMQWDDSKNAGFTTGEPWLPVHDDYETINAKAENADQASVLAAYKKLAGFRRDNPVLINGSYEEKLADSDQLYAFVRENEDDKLLIIANFTGAAVDFNCKEAGIDDEKTAEILLTNYENYKDSEESGNSADESADGNVKGAKLGTLRPWETLVIRCK